jgi:hypothetical protein
LTTRSSPTAQTGLGRSWSVCKDTFHSGLTSTAFWSRVGRPCWTDWNAVRKIVQVMECTPAPSRLEGHPAGRVARNAITRMRLRAVAPRRAPAGDVVPEMPGGGRRLTAVRHTPRHTSVFVAWKVAGFLTAMTPTPPSPRAAPAVNGPSILFVCPPGGAGEAPCFDPPRTTATVPVDRYAADRTSAVLAGRPGVAIRQWTGPNQPWPVPGGRPRRGQVAEHGHFSPTVGLVRGAGSGELGGPTFWPAALPVEWVSRRSEGVLSRPAGNEFADLWTAGLTEDEYMGNGFRRRSAGEVSGKLGRPPIDS